MDVFRDRTISKIFNAVIDRSTQHATACPPREKWSWQTFWSKLNKKELDNEKVEKNQQEEQNVNNEIYQAPKIKDYSIDIKALCSTTYCNIKMQDPCEICCCTQCRIDEDTPCEGVPRGQRRSICECDPQEKYNKDHECCDACEHHGFRRV